MNASDFEYDGKYLSDFGFIICNFNKGSAPDIKSAGSEISFHTVQRHGGKLHSLTGTKYDNCVTATFHICKNPCRYSDLYITNDEYRCLTRWLNRREFLHFQLLDTDSVEKEPCFYDASFNIGKIMFNGDLYGLELTMVTNRPFGYGREISSNFDVNAADGTFELEDLSDEIGYLYPSVEITVKDPGKLIIQNDMTGCALVIDRCRAGEVISINGDTKVIQTSDSTHDICNDFNYDYLSIGNRYEDRLNTFHVSIPCRIEIKYSPIIKDTPD